MIYSYNIIDMEYIDIVSYSYTCLLYTSDAADE